MTILNTELYGKQAKKTRNLYLSRQVVFKQIGLKLFFTLVFLQIHWFEVSLTLTGFFEQVIFEFLTTAGFFRYTGLKLFGQ